MDECARKDFISNLPHGIIEIILTKLPIRDAVRTSVLSTEWRYRWATMTILVFDKNCVCVPHGSIFNEEKLFNFMLRCLFLHDGPINKFRLSTSCLDKYPDMDQCLLFLSRKHLKELVLKIDLLDPMLPAPSAIFSCQRLTSLTLCGFELKPPLTFRGFPCLKYLKLDYDIVTREVVEDLISGSPLLEKLKILNYEHLAFMVRAPNLKHLILDGNFKHIYVEHAPLLVDISIEIDTEVSEVPNLQKLQISAEAFGCAFFKPAGTGFWEKGCPTDFTMKHLKKVQISGVSNKKDMEFIKFVLGRSPVLKVMRVSHHDNSNDNMKN
ncbi:F-box/RNI-like superfamily protein [Heracleum sosnowskyi]|uniref:F-box/RNI-like superfamily protein n=1 Tax=Heracleum sosnowskyi TaxID=360622 RepID=A0AAD8HYC1_9APIA|nr:F-box/RNI-like superfamily protein [Heracleum sosnowskyi]